MGHTRSSLSYTELNSVPSFGGAHNFRTQFCRFPPIYGSRFTATLAPFPPFRSPDLQSRRITQSQSSIPDRWQHCLFRGSAICDGSKFSHTDTLRSDAEFLVLKVRALKSALGSFMRPAGIPLELVPSFHFHHLKVT